MRSSTRGLVGSGALALVALVGCSEYFALVESDATEESGGMAETSGSGSGTSNGDGDTGDGDPGDGDPGDGDPSDGDPGDGDPGDGEPGDGDPGDGDPGDGDGDRFECASDDDCMSGNCLDGECVIVNSCLELNDVAYESRVYQLNSNEGPYEAYCDLETDGGGWTLVLKASGLSSEFSYDSVRWLETMPFNPQFPDLDRQEAKLRSYSKVSFGQVMIGFEVPVGQSGNLTLETVVVDVGVESSSLYTVLSTGQYIPTSMGRSAWWTLIGGSDFLQEYCDREGFNVRATVQNNLGFSSRVKIGLIANNQDSCSTPDSLVGVGGAGSSCSSNAPSVGAYNAGCGDEDEVEVPAFGVVFVR